MKKDIKDFYITLHKRTKTKDGYEWKKVVKEIERKGMSVKDEMIYVKTTRGVKYAYKTV
jgi:hypothetical protein